MLITIFPDTPAPRCAKVTAAQRLRIVNRSGDYGQPARTIVITFAGLPPRTLAYREGTTYDASFGTYLAPGVHVVQVDLYGDGGPAIWLGDWS